MAGFGQSMFFEAAARPGLFSTAVEPPYMPFGSGGLFAENPMIGMFAQMGAQWAFGPTGMLPGQFSPTQNMYDQIMARRFMRERMEATRRGFQADRPEVIRMLRGLSEAVGVDFGMDQLRAADSIAETFMGVMPYVASMAPMTFDAMFGAEGSRGIAADTLFRRGRHMVDPVTGRTGLTAETASGLAERMFQNLYRAGPEGAGLREMRGMGQGTAAALLAELDRMGMVGRSAGLMSTPERSAALGLPEDVLRAGGPGVEEALRNFDARQATDAVKKMAGAVSAVRDLFGDHGRADAPMNQLLQALNDLSAGGMQMRDPARLEQDVRTVKALMQSGGVTLDAYGSLLARAGATAQAYGLDPAMASGIAQGSLAAGIAYQRTGMGSVRAFGALSQEAFVQRDLQLRAGAANSGQANQLAALVRYQEEVGARGGRGLEGEDLEIYQAAVEGRTTYGPDGKPMHFDHGEIQRRLARYAGEEGARSMLRARDVNAAYVDRHGIGDLVRDAGQGERVRRLTADAFQAALANNPNVGDRSRIREASNRMSAALLDMDFADVTDPAKRNAALMEAMGDLIADPADRLAAVSAAYDQFSVMSRETLGRNHVETLQLNNRRVAEEKKRTDRESRETAALAQAMSPLNQAGPMARIADALKQPGADFKTTIGKILGFVDQGEIDQALRGGVRLGDLSGRQRLVAASAAVQSLHEAFQGADAATRGTITGSIEAILGEDADQLEVRRKALADQFGISREDQRRIDAGLPPRGDVPEFAQRAYRGMGAALGSPGGGGPVGLLNLAREQGIDDRVKVEARDLEETAAKGVQASKLIENRGGLTDEQRERAAKLVEATLGDVRRYTDAALLDESGRTMAALGGPEAVTKVRRAREIAGHLSAAAAEFERKTGRRITPAELITSGDPEIRAWADQNDIAAKFDELNAISNELAGEARKRPKPDSELTPAERDARDKRLAETKERTAEARDGVMGLRSQNEKALDALLKGSGGDLSDDQKKQILDKLDEAADPEAASYEFRRATYAAEELRRGRSADGRELAGAGLEDRRKRAGTLADIGDVDAGGLGRDQAATGDAINQFVDRIDGKDEEGAAAGPRELTITFPPGTTLKLDSEGNLAFGGVKATGVLGSTDPVA